MRKEQLERLKSEKIGLSDKIRTIYSMSLDDNFNFDTEMCQKVLNEWIQDEKTAKEYLNLTYMCESGNMYSLHSGNEWEDIFSEKTTYRDILLDCLTGKLQAFATEEDERQATAYKQAAATIKEPAAPKPVLQPVSANDLMQLDIPPLKYVIADICPAGFGILAAPPKYYKSFLALQICIAICNGDKVLGKKTAKTKCLYFDLESTKRRPQERLKQMGAANVEGLEIVTLDEMPKVGHRPMTLETGFDKMLEDYLTANPDIGFIVIDVFRKIRSEQKRTQSLYDHDYEDIEKLQALAAKKNVCLLLLHHTTKFKDESDPFNSMGGSTGLFGAADFAWLITKEKRNEKEATLHIDGRDIRPDQMSIRFNDNKLNWEYLGTAEEVQSNREMQTYLNHHITRTVKQLVDIGNGRYEGTATEIINKSHLLKLDIYEKPQHVGRFLQKNMEYFSIEANIEISYSAGTRERKYTFTQQK